MIQAPAPGQHVVGNVQDMIALPVRQMYLQQANLVVEGVDQSALPGNLVNHAKSHRHPMATARPAIW